MTEASYDIIGKTYDNTRKADPEIVERIIELLHIKARGRYLDMGCGSGNYTGALAQNGLQIEGIDISSEMLNKARKKYPEIIFHQGDARSQPFPDNAFDGTICILATHHIGNNDKIFREAFRVIHKGYFVIFTATPEQMCAYWLCYYFPDMISRAMTQMTRFNELKDNLKQAGFSNIQQMPFFVTEQLQDWFLQAGKYRPEIYLNPIVRQGISTFHLFANPIEVEEGLKQIAKDIESGKIKEIIEDYESTVGDYLFVSAEKS